MEKARFEECWETIQLAFNFMSEHFNEEVRSRATLLYSENVEKLFNTIRVAISPGNRSPQEIHAEIASLVKLFEIENADQCKEPPRPKPTSATALDVEFSKTWSIYYHSFS